jgi:hypothetical protein
MKTDYEIASHAYSWCHEEWDGEYMALTDGLKDELVYMYYQKNPGLLEEAFPAMAYALGVEQALAEIYEPETESRLAEILRNVLYTESEDALREICNSYYQKLLMEDYMENSND